MEDFHAAATTKTPEIVFTTEGEFKIIGNSYPEDVREFYENALAWLDEFFASNSNPVTLDIHLKYINTSSTKIMLNIINKVNTLSKGNITVRWICENDDEDMLSTGEDLQKLSNLKFEFVHK